MSEQTETPERLRELDGSVELADLSQRLVPLVRAFNRGAGGGVPMAVDATLALLSRLGVLSGPTQAVAPELVLREGAGGVATCDWGFCQGPAIALRWSDDEDAYLAVCADCAVAAPEAS